MQTQTRSGSRCSSVCIIRRSCHRCHCWSLAAVSGICGILGVHVGRHVHLAVLFWRRRTLCCGLWLCCCRRLSQRSSLGLWLLGASLWVQLPSSQLDVVGRGCLRKRLRSRPIGPVQQALILQRGRPREHKHVMLEHGRRTEMCCLATMRKHFHRYTGLCLICSGNQRCLRLHAGDSQPHSSRTLHQNFLCK